MGGWQVVPQEKHWIQVKNRDGEVGNIALRELTERDVRAKNAKMIQFNRKSGDPSSARVRLEAIRAYEMEQSIVDWDLTDADGNKLEINRMTINLLPQAIANQIHDEIMKLNDLPTEDEDEEEEDSDLEDEDEENYLDDGADHEGGEVVDFPSSVSPEDASLPQGVVGGSGHPTS